MNPPATLKTGSLPSHLGKHLLILVAVSLTTAIFPSCHKQEDPALLQKNEQQKAEIKRLEGEVAVLDEKLKNAPADRSEDLANARKEAATQQEELSKLEKEVAIMEARKTKIEGEFKQYREKYPVKTN